MILILLNFCSFFFAFSLVVVYLLSISNRVKVFCHFACITQSRQILYTFILLSIKPFLCFIIFFPFCLVIFPIHIYIALPLSLFFLIFFFFMLFLICHYPRQYVATYFGVFSFLYAIVCQLCP